jgi:hypothetical protein
MPCLAHPVERISEAKLDLKSSTEAAEHGRVGVYDQDGV